MSTLTGTLTGSNHASVSLPAPAQSISFSLTLTEVASASGTNVLVGSPYFSIGLGTNTSLITGTVALSLGSSQATSTVNAGSLVGTNNLASTTENVPDPQSAGQTLCSVSFSGTSTGAQIVQAGSVFIYPQNNPVVLTTINNNGAISNFSSSNAQEGTAPGSNTLIADTLSVGIDQAKLQYTGTIANTSVAQTITLSVPATVYDGGNIPFTGSSSVPLANGLMQVIDGDLAPNTLAAAEALPSTKRSVYEYIQSVSGTTAFSGQAGGVDNTSQLRPYYGTHTLAVADAVTGQLSNFATFTLAPQTVEALTLSVANQPAYQNIAVSGSDSAPLAAGLDYQLDGAVWQENAVANFVPGANWTGQTIAVLPGPHTLTVRNNSAPGTVSNTVTFQASSSGSSSGSTTTTSGSYMLTITSANGTHGVPATISGVVAGGTPATLDISYDGGETFPDTVEVGYSSGGSFTLVGTTVL